MFVGGSLVTDITSHPGFRHATESVAAIFDLKLDAASGADLVVDDWGDGPRRSLERLLAEAAP